jgi:hypothetical protein
MDVYEISLMILNWRVRTLRAGDGSAFANGLGL